MTWSRNLNQHQHATAAAGIHPCFFEGASRRFARMHLPVAPRCNIQCNYCNRLFDCLHESRPGVTSTILTPEAALQKFLFVREKLPNLSVVGIAGPGDALAEWEKTSAALALIRKVDADVSFCLSTNGLLLPRYSEEILELGINYVTVTVNCISPASGRRIYKYILYEGERYEGEDAFEILYRNQMSGIERLARAGVNIKVNTVMIRGINDREIPGIVEEVRQRGAFMSNIMPLIPAPGSAFADFSPTSPAEVNAMRNKCRLILKQMRHCRQCRADAVGLLHEDLSEEIYGGKGLSIKRGGLSGS